MHKTNLTLKSTLEEAYMEQEKLSDWSPNSKNVYRRNINSISSHMQSVGLEPTIENVTYEYCLQWKKDHTSKNPNTLKQQKSTMASLFRHLNNANIIDGNPFLTVKITDYTTEKYLSKDLNITELYQVYKAAHELQTEGVNVLAPMLLDIYTGLRSTNLIRLTVQSLDFEAGGIHINFAKTNKNDEEEVLENEMNLNSKNRESFIPLPPKVLTFFSNYIKGMHPEDSLLYGLRGKSFANKQMNYVVTKVCHHLGWIVNSGDNGGSNSKSKQNNKIKTDKYFTPHGLRYSIATIFHEMGVEDNAIRLLLLHSKKTELGALERYLRRDTREVKQLRMAQILLETVLETAFEIDEKFGVQVELEAIYEQLPVAFENQMKNIYHVNLFRDQIIRFTMSKMELLMTQSSVVPMNQHPILPMGEANFPMESHPFTPTQYQGPYFQSVMGMSAPMNVQQPPQAPYGYYQPSGIQDFFSVKK
ncbi:tyrosine-type recombinase/integrase [Cytobacillus praedii]|uniref:tyrosine-type recombinase/integrase n=1 Tax=Cytobacillus praedii TaxID=1742358 RepID=UPI002E1DAB7E|nr:tyrosine-type recombinase/integrase [Cytobacillus praedii]MED3550298.1 tyrosine-type recombinase/integrase [Cytobacillus praedii]